MRENVAEKNVYAEKPMGSFYHLIDICIISSVIGMDKIALSVINHHASIIIDSGDFIHR